MRKCMLCSLIFLAIGQSTSAHEFWIEPEAYQTKPGKALRIRMKLGERFLGEGFRRNNKLIDHFVAVGPDKTRPIVGQSGSATSYARFDSEGIHVLGYHSKRVPNEMAAGPFEKYLREEGLAAIIQRREALGERTKPGREVFSRCAKSLVRVGSNHKGHDRILGMPLEIVPLSSPISGDSKSGVPFRVLFQGDSLMGTTVVAVNASQPHKFHRAVTDREGRVVFKLPKDGAWLITTIHMVRAPSKVDADWESFWASLTFERKSMVAG